LFQNPGRIVKLYKLFKEQKPQIVHTHFLDATVLGLTAALFAGVKHRIYTRHHSTYHHKFAKKGVYYDRYSNMLATKIIAISSVVEKVLCQNELAPKRKVVIIHHGFRINRFSHPDHEQVQKLKQKYNKGNRTPVIGVISRHIQCQIHILFQLNPTNTVTLAIVPMGLLIHHKSGIIFLNLYLSPY